MNSKKIILTDHQSVSDQLVAQPVSDPDKGLDTYWMWGVLGICMVVSVGCGIYSAYNPTDQWVAVLAWMPICLVGVDVFLVGFLLFKNCEIRALWLPVGMSILHSLLWAWALHLASFDVLYVLTMQTDFYGIYDVQWGVLLLLISIGILAFGSTVYEIGVVGQVVDALDIPIVNEGAEAEDVPLSGDYIFDAQVLLNNLGYDVGSIDGILGPKTNAALKQFQSVSGLAPDGVVTVRTLTALRQKGQKYEHLSWMQMGFTFIPYWFNRLVGFLQTQWMMKRWR